MGREMLERAVAAVDPNAAIRDVQSLEAHIGRGFATERMLSTLLVAFGTTAIALTALGLYGLVSNAVSSRQRELAVRIALGATPARITLLLLGRLGWILTAGLAGGVAGALATGRTLSAFLFGVTPGDPAILTLACGLLLVSTLLATAAPLTRAVLTEPAAIMRE